MNYKADTPNMERLKLIAMLIPLIVGFIIGGYRLFEVIHTVDELRVRSFTEGERLRDEVDLLFYRVETLEKYCCDELDK